MLEMKTVAEVRKILQWTAPLYQDSEKGLAWCFFFARFWKNYLSKKMFVIFLLACLNLVETAWKQVKNVFFFFDFFLSRLC